MKPATFSLEYTDENGTEHEISAERTNGVDEWAVEHRKRDAGGPWHYQATEYVTDLELEGALSHEEPESTAIRGDI